MVVVEETEQPSHGTILDSALARVVMHDRIHGGQHFFVLRSHHYGSGSAGG